MKSQLRLEATSRFLVASQYLNQPHSLRCVKIYLRAPPPASCCACVSFCGRECHSRVPPSCPRLKTTIINDTANSSILIRRWLQTRYLCSELLLAPPHFALCVQRRFDGRESRARVLQRGGKLTNTIIGDTGSKTAKMSTSVCLYACFSNMFWHKINSFDHFCQTRPVLSKPDHKRRCNWAAHSRR